MKIFFFGLLFLLDAYVFSFKDDEWDYKEKGPETDAWCQASETCCNGTRQSPFVLREKIYNLFPFEKMNLVDYDKEIQLTALNNGKTVVFTINEGSAIPTIGGLNMDKNYTFYSMVFHWGSNGTLGSEHAIKGPRAKGEMEVQLVHYKSKFKSYEEALKSKEKDPIAIMSIIFATSVVNKFDVKMWITPNISSAMTSIVNSLPNIIKPGQTTTVTIRLQDLYSNGANNAVYHYMGSLTTPPCYEIVRWYIFARMTKISDDQLNAFWKLKVTDSLELSNNFRPLNPKKELPKLTKTKLGVWLLGK